MKKSIKICDISSLTLNDKNPRINDAAADKLIPGIEKYGFINPVIVNKDNLVLAGHTRIKALLKMGESTVPAIYVDMDPTTAKGFSIWDNKSGEFSEWDDDLLKQELEELNAEDFDISLTGFDESDFDFDKEPGLTDEDKIPDVPEKPVTKLGDLWILGDHRVLCGDSTDAEQIKNLMGKDKADVVFTDPPYGMHLDTDWSGAKSSLKFAKDKNALGGKKHKQVIGDHDDFTPSLIKTVFDNFGYCKEIFLWGADYYAEHLQNKNDGSWVVWDKRLDESADKMYGSTFELCWSKFRHKRMLARVKWAGIFGTEKEFDHKRHHPTQKPVALVEWFFDYYSFKDKKIIVDVYGGAGGTLIACEKYDKQCRMMELDPHYCDVIIKRWEDYTGNKAVLGG